MPLDPTKNPDWKIAQAAEKNMKTVYELGDELGLRKEELLPHGHHVAKLDFNKILRRLNGLQVRGRYRNHTHPAWGGQVHNHHGPHAGHG
jgi:formate--tetrahydrofolate ligase